jgi:alcohol dehydrogenase
VGEIVEFGAEAARRDFGGSEVGVGDRVTWAIVASCGECEYCLRGLPQKCERGIKYGHESLRPGLELLGGLAEYCMLVPGTAIVRVPDALPLSVVCPASCATATIAWAMEAAGDVRDRTVCVLGAGLLGLTATAMAQSRGAREIVCVDPDSNRRERTLSFGATRAIAPEGLEQEIFAHSAKANFDVVFEISGQPAAFQSVWPAVRTGGTMVLVGAVFPANPVSLTLEQVVRRCLTIRGVHNYAPRHLLQAIAFLAASHNTYPFHELIGNWLPLSAIHDAFVQAGHPQMIRVGIDPTLRP